MITYEFTVIRKNIPHPIPHTHTCTKNAPILCFFSKKGFHIPYVVENFPMKERTDEELKEVNRVLQQKKIETECLKVQFNLTLKQSVYISDVLYFKVSFTQIWGGMQFRTSLDIVCIYIFIACESAEHNPNEYGNQTREVKGPRPSTAVAGL